MTEKTGQSGTDSAESPRAVLHKAALAAQELCEARAWPAELGFWGLVLLGVVLASLRLRDQVEAGNANFLLVACALALGFTLASGLYSAWYRARLVHRAPSAALLLGAKDAPQTAGKVAASVARLVLIRQQDRKTASLFEAMAFILPLVGFIAALPILFFIPFGEGDYREYVLLATLVPGYFFLSTLIRVLVWETAFSPRLAAETGKTVEEVLSDFGFERGRLWGWVSVRPPIYFRSHAPVDQQQAALAELEHDVEAFLEEEDAELSSAGEEADEETIED